MKVTELLCDICGSKPAYTIRTTVDRVPDAAGSMEDIQDSMDLCPEHLVSAIGCLTVKLDHTARKEFLNVVWQLAKADKNKDLMRKSMERLSSKATIVDHYGDKV